MAQIAERAETHPHQALRHALAEGAAAAGCASTAKAADAEDGNLEDWIDAMVKGEEQAVDPA